MQVTYSIYDMIHDLKLGKWQGGEIEKLGYVGKIMDKKNYQKLGHNRYLSLSYDTFIDTIINTKNKTGITLKVCVYCPYKKEYEEYHLPTAINLVDFMNKIVKLEQ